MAELTKGEVRALHLDTTDGSRGKRGFRLVNHTNSTKAGKSQHHLRESSSMDRKGEGGGWG